MSVLDALRTQAGDLRAFGRYARELPGFLGRPLRPEQAEATVAAALARRDVALVELLHRIQASQEPVSPAAPARRHRARRRRAARGRARSGGRAQPALRRRRPPDGSRAERADGGRSRRPGALHRRRGRSRQPARGRGRRRHHGVQRRAAPRALRARALGHEAAHQHIALHAGGVEAHDLALWRPVPPGIAGLNDVLRNGHLGRPIVRWFSQFPTGAGAGQRATRRWSPRRVRSPRGQASRSRSPSTFPSIGRRSSPSGSPAHDRPVFLNTTSSSGVRVCGAARERDLDIAGPSSVSAASRSPMSARIASPRSAAGRSCTTR